jgi:hypothetical protein
MQINYMAAIGSGVSLENSPLGYIDDQTAKSSAASTVPANPRPVLLAQYADGARRGGLDSDESGDEISQGPAETPKASKTSSTPHSKP